MNILALSHVRTAGACSAALEATMDPEIKFAI
jgi:hypothetical protein